MSSSTNDSGRKALRWVFSEILDWCDEELVTALLTAAGTSPRLQDIFEMSTMPKSVHFSLWNRICLLKDFYKEVTASGQSIADDWSNVSGEVIDNYCFHRTVRRRIHAGESLWGKDLSGVPLDDAEHIPRLPQAETPFTMDPSVPEPPEPKASIAVAVPASPLVTETPNTTEALTDGPVESLGDKEMEVGVPATFGPPETAAVTVVGSADENCRREDRATVARLLVSTSEPNDSEGEELVPSGSGPPSVGSDKGCDALVAPMVSGEPGQGLGDSIATNGPRARPSTARVSVRVSDAVPDPVPDHHAEAVSVPAANAESDDVDAEPADTTFESVVAAKPVDNKSADAVDDGGGTICTTASSHAKPADVPIGTPVPMIVLMNDPEHRPHALEARFQVVGEPPPLPVPPERHRQYSLFPKTPRATSFNALVTSYLAGRMSFPRRFPSSLHEPEEEVHFVPYSKTSSPRGPSSTYGEEFVVFDNSERAPTVPQAPDVADSATSPKTMESAVVTPPHSVPRSLSPRHTVPDLIAWVTPSSEDSTLYQATSGFASDSASSCPAMNECHLVHSVPCSAIESPLLYAKPTTRHLASLQSGRVKSSIDIDA